MTSYISIKLILSNLLDHPMLQDLTLERAVDYAVRFIQIIGAPTEFLEKTLYIKILDYRGILPCDFYEIILVRTYNEGDEYPKVFRYADDSFHHSPNKETNTLLDTWDLTYKILNSIIFTSLKEGTIEIAYRAIMVDDEGYPLIPENSSFILALELFIKKKVFTILFDLGKIPPAVLLNTLLEYAWYVGQALRDLNRVSVDKMESLSNMWCLLILRNNEHTKGFKSLGRREFIKVL